MGDDWRDTGCLRLRQWNLDCMCTALGSISVVRVYKKGVEYIDRHSFVLKPPRTRAGRDVRGARDTRHTRRRHAPNMCWRQVSKFQKTVIVIVLYSLIYFFLSTIARPEPIYNFVKEDLRIGDKYVLIYLISNTPVFSDAEGSDVFVKRQCGNCFITNNKGFLPLSEYDAVVVHGHRRKLAEASAYMDPEKRYLMETRKECLEKKLVGCGTEPKMTSFSTRVVYDLGSLCHYLHEARKTDLEPET